MLGQLGQALEDAHLGRRVIANADEEGPDAPVLHREAALSLLDRSGRVDGAVANLLMRDPNAPFGQRLDPDAVIAQFNGLDQRNDIGVLWENFMFIERLKYRAYLPLYANKYFWRTYDKQEIDLVEEYGGNLYGYEFKWSDGKAAHRNAPRRWTEAYPNAKFKVIHSDNYQEFVMG